MAVPKEEIFCTYFVQSNLNVVDSLQKLSIKEIKTIYQENSNQVKIGCLNLTSDNSIGIIVRSASLFGVSEIFVIGKRKYNCRTTVGSHNYIDVTPYKATIGHTNDEYDFPVIFDFLENIQKTHTLILVEQGGKNLTGAFENLEKPPFFLVGNEGKGIPSEIVEKFSESIVSIPQSGVNRSHNVGVATSIVLWEYFRTRI